jgi:hypothetical protein
MSGRNRWPIAALVAGALLIGTIIVGSGRRRHGWLFLAGFTYLA